jgi:hypothetical protein
MKQSPKRLVLVLSLLVAGAVLVEEGAALVGLPFTPFSFAGVARRTTRRVVAVDATAATAATAETAAVETNAAAAAQPVPAFPTPAPQAAKPAAPAPHGAPPIGTTVGTLPTGCVSSPVNDIAYQDCGGVYYRPAFSGNNLVYVVVEKP